MTIDPADRHEILDLISQYVYCVDEQDWELFGTLWTDDAVQYGRNGESRSKPEIVATYRTVIAQLRANPDYQWSQHHTTNTVLSEIDESRVVGKTRWFNLLQRASQDRAFVGNSGHYLDEFVRTPEGWRFASRRIERNPGWKEG